MKERLTKFLVLSFLALVIAGAWVGPLQDAARTRIDAGLTRALASFATARGLNAILSPIQGVRFSFEPLGVGTSVAAGQVLRPINDLIGQFAELMLAASVAFGLMKVLVAIGGHWAVSLLLTVLVSGWAWFRIRGGRCPALIESLLLVLLLVRFAMPVTAVGSDVLFHEFLQADYSATQKALDANHGALLGLSPELAKGDAGKGEAGKAQGWWSKIDPAQWVRKVGELSNQLVQHVIRLVVVFAMQTVVVPLVLLWALYRAGRAVIFPVPQAG